MEIEMVEGLMERMVTAASSLEAAVLKLEAVSVAASAGGLRKTVAASGLVSKDGIAVEAGAGALDAALSCLSVEQRIAVKAEMLRSGLLG